MLRHHKLISFCVGLGFLIVLQKFASPAPIFRFLLPAFVFYAAIVTLYNRWYLTQIQKYNVWVLLRPLLLFASAFGVFFFTQDQTLRGLILIGYVFIITLFEVILGKQAENILLNETLVIAFGIFFVFFAAYLYAPAYQTLYLAGVFAGATLLARTFYEFIPQSSQAKIVGSVFLGLFCSELFWALNFLPLHFSVLSLLLFNFFYFCLILNYYYLFHILNLKKIQFHLFLMAATSIFALLATPWIIIN